MCKLIQGKMETVTGIKMEAFLFEIIVICVPSTKIDLVYGMIICFVLL